MKICLAQIQSEKGKIDRNIQRHKKWIETAISTKADLILFHELSLTGYEPALAQELATDQNDSRLDEFQNISNLNNIAIGVGLPTTSENGILISMIIFQPNLPRTTYSKQKLHPDEHQYFVEGSVQVLLTIKKTKIALAICYESLLSAHSENAKSLGAEVYIASVAKSNLGIGKAYAHFPKIANNYSMPVLMVNSIGFCDNFQSVGQTSAWDENGVLVGQLDHQNEGLLIYDSVSQTTNLTETTHANKSD